MDTAQILTLVTGSGGALIVLILWVRSLQATITKLETAVQDKDAENAELTVKVISLATDVQRSLNEKSGCRYPPPQR